MDIQKTGLDVFLLKEDEYEKKASIIKEMKKLHKKICYVCLSNTAPLVSEGLRTGGLDASGLFFIDTLSSYYGKQKPTKHITYISSPSEIQEIFNTILKMRESCDVFVFDAIIMLLHYHDSSSILKFTNDIIKNSKIVYFVLKSNILSKRDIKRFTDDIVMFADKTTDLT